ncbi:hypothetical protein EIP86_003288 [Pleurotus ostreatoroseus]|nr:hypothetical protein EIP86_003288 [Pleurotus ostreatoroseus]
MGRFLEVEDVVIMMQYLYDQADPREKPFPGPQVRATFAALAVTCRAFHKPAMNALWRDIGIMDLLRAVANCSAPQDWDRIYVQVQGVRSFHLRFLSEYQTIEKDTVRVLDTLRSRGSYVFPNLVELECDMHSNHTVYSYAHLLAGPSLRRLSFNQLSRYRLFDSYPSSPLLEMLDKITLAYPGITDFSCQCLWPISQWPQSFDRLEKLRSLSLSIVLNPAVMTGVTTLPYLQHLKICLSGWPNPEQLAALNSPFPHITSLSISVIYQPLRLIACARVAQYFPQLQTLRVVCVYNTRHPSVSECRRLLTILGRCLFLVNLAIEGLVPLSPAPMDATDPISPLYALPNVEQLRIGSSKSLGNVDLEQLGKAWPRLRYISIHDLTRTQKFKYAQILSLARLSPSLTVAELHMESPVPEPALIRGISSGEAYPAPNVRFLVLDAIIPFEDHELVARSLLCAFPRLEGITCSAPRETRLFGDMEELFHRSHRFALEDAVLGRWKEVNRIIRETRK